jgi:hypothetical protein
LYFKGVAIMNRKRLQAVIGLLIGVLLLAQLAVAAYSCPGVVSMGAAVSMTGMNMAPPSDVGTAALDVNGTDLADCSGMALQARDPQNANLCAEHCRYGQQGDQTPSLTVPVVVLTALYAVTQSIAAPAAMHSTDPTTINARVAASPSHSILHCCLRI